MFWNAWQSQICPRSRFLEFQMLVFRTVRVSLKFLSIYEYTQRAVYLTVMLQPLTVSIFKWDTHSFIFFFNWWRLPVSLMQICWTYDGRTRRISVAWSLPFKVYQRNVCNRRWMVWQSEKLEECLFLEECTARCLSLLAIRPLRSVSQRNVWYFLAAYLSFTYETDDSHK